MTDWIEHNGGPQPVREDVWVEIECDPLAYSKSGAQEAGLIEWCGVTRWRVLNQDEIDAARLEGIRLGLDAAARACQAQAEEFLSPSYAVDQPLSSFAERFACGRCADEIRNLNPDTIARDVQTISHQEKCDNLHIAREAQDMGSDTSASTSA